MRDRRPELSDDPRDEADYGDSRFGEELPIQRPRLRRHARGEGRERDSLKQLARDLPNFVKLLWRLYRDPRVSRVDKGIVLVTIGYLVSPWDFIPDYLPFLGQIDDIYLLALALDRLLNNAGIDVLLDHWEGDVASLETAIAALDRAGSFLPEQIRSLLHRRIG